MQTSTFFLIGVSLFSIALLYITWPRKKRWDSKIPTSFDFTDRVGKK